MERIRLALQGYNFGADVYFSYMEENREDVWSQKSAEAFAQMASGNTLREDSDPLKEAAGPGPTVTSAIRSMCSVTITQRAETGLPVKFGEFLKIFQKTFDNPYLLLYYISCR